MNDMSRSATSLYVTSDRMPAQRGEVPCLDGFRAISITLVLLGHFVSRKVPGGLGVIVFFVVSGFLITRLMISENRSTGTLAVGLFYARRILRLYPLIVVFSAAVLVAAVLKHRNYHIVEPISALFYFANYYYSSLFLSGARETLPFTIFWSLSIEEHFYFVFPFVFLLCRGNTRWLTVAVVGTIVLCFGMRLIVADAHPEYVSQSNYFYLRTEYRVDSIAAGVLMALACETDTGRKILASCDRWPVVLASTIVLILCLTVRDPWFRETVRYTLLNGSVFGLLAAVLFSNRFRPLNIALNSAPLVAVGKLSYSIYVWHLGVAFFIGANAYPFPLRLVLEFGVTGIVAVFSFYCIERPFLRLRTHFGSQQRG